MTIEQFDAIIQAAEAHADEAESLWEAWRDAQDYKVYSTFQTPSWDLITARRLAVRYFDAPPGEYREYLRGQIDMALEPGPNDAHVGAPRW